MTSAQGSAGLAWCLGGHAISCAPGGVRIGALSSMAALFPPGSQSSDKYANHGEYQYAVSAGNALSLCQRKELHHLHTTWRATRPVLASVSALVPWGSA